MSINIEEKHINSIMQTQQHFKKILINYMQQIAYSTDYINLDYADKILKFLEDLKKSLNYCNQNILLLENILKINNPEQDAETLETVFKNTLYIEDFLFLALSFSELKFFNNTCHIEKNTIPSVENNVNTRKAEQPTSEDNVFNNDSYDKKTQTNCNNKLEENTLIISETKGKIFLPYNIFELKKIQSKNPNEYLNIMEVIEKKYTLSFESFKNLSIARFREAFKLARNIEKKSIKFSFDLGMELLFNYNLHPAIIAACKNLDMLDIYLDYLENNETDKFDCFKIVFEMAPIISKRGRN